MDDIAVSLQEVSKYYKLYDSPRDRFKEALDPFRRRRYREFYALSNINLKIKKKEILGIVGRNGSGKSTLLKLIAGVIPPSSGHLAVNGKISALMDLGSGLDPDLSGMDNVYFGGIMMGFSREEMESRMEEIITFADIGNFINQPLKTYSSGMKARLGFALAISVKPEILVVDEVLAVGDDLFKRKCFAKMQELFRSGCTIIFVSHSIPNVNELCTRAILLDNGEMLLEGPPAMVTRHYQTLLYASPEMQKEVRDGIGQINMNRNEKEERSGHADTGQRFYLDRQDQEYREILDIIEEQNKVKRPVAYFIPNFIPKTTKKHEVHDVKISDLQIHDMSGEIVNALVMEEPYTFSYKVQFGGDLDKVKFAMLIQNMRGVAVSGFSIQTDDACSVRKGDVYLIQNHFKCTLLPGTYFINISLNQVDKSGKRACLYAIDDALAFRVQHEKIKFLWRSLQMDYGCQIKNIHRE